MKLRRVLKKLFLGVLLFSAVSLALTACAPAGCIAALTGPTPGPQTQMTTREAQVNHRYGLSGFYTAAVTATNEAGSINAKTLVTIDNTKMYLLLAMK